MEGHRMAPLRLFIAVDPPPPLRVAFAAASRELAPALRGVRWVRPETLHLTLKFLGDTPAERVAEIISVSRDALARLGEGHVAFAGLGVFPSLRRPSVLWAGVRGGCKWLTEAATRVDAALATLGFPAETRRFRPHLTLGRVRRGTRVPAGRLEEAIAAFAEHRFGTAPIRFATLYASSLGKEGASHKPLAKLPFTVA
jgi:RNA 2',3'-cyclic 3'-phosphodiesterase